MKSKHSASKDFLFLSSTNNNNKRDDKLSSTPKLKNFSKISSMSKDPICKNKNRTLGNRLIDKNYNKN